MFGLLKSGVFKIGCLVNIVVVGAKLLSGVLSSVAKTVGAFKVWKIPVGKPFGALFSMLAAPFSLVGKLLVSMLVADAILLLILLILGIVKRRKRKQAMKEAATEAVITVAEENTRASSRWMNIFK